MAKTRSGHSINYDDLPIDFSQSLLDTPEEESTTEFVAVRPGFFDDDDFYSKNSSINKSTQTVQTPQANVHTSQVQPLEILRHQALNSKKPEIANFINKDEFSTPQFKLFQSRKDKALSSFKDLEKIRSKLMGNKVGLEREQARNTFIVLFVKEIEDLFIKLSELSKTQSAILRSQEIQLKNKSPINSQDLATYNYNQKIYDQTNLVKTFFHNLLIKFYSILHNSELDGQQKTHQITKEIVRCFALDWRIKLPNTLGSIAEDASKVLVIYLHECILNTGVEVNRAIERLSQPISNPVELQQSISKPTQAQSNRQTITTASSESDQAQTNQQKQVSQPISNPVELQQSISKPTQAQSNRQTITTASSEPDQVQTNQQKQENILIQTVKPSNEPRTLQDQIIEDYVEPVPKSTQQQSTTAHVNSTMSNLAKGSSNNSAGAPTTNSKGAGNSTPTTSRKSSVTSTSSSGLSVGEQMIYTLGDAVSTGVSKGVSKLYNFFSSSNLDTTQTPTPGMRRSNS